ncbi:hypothetical protein D3C78_1698690 [compost metagenome]
MRLACVLETYHPICAVSGDDDETIVFTGFMFGEGGKAVVDAMITWCSQIECKKGAEATFSTLMLIYAARSLVQ